MTAALELRDHHGHLVEARNDRGQLIYAQRSNYERTRELLAGRVGRGSFRNRGHALLTGRLWPEPSGAFGFRSAAHELDRMGDYVEPLAQADRHPRRRRGAVR